MGNSQPTNRTGKNVVAKKLENSKKIGVLSLSEHSLETIPTQVFEIKNLRTLDISKNKLKSLGFKLAGLGELKILNCDNNLLTVDALTPVSSLSKLQNLSAGGNHLGKLLPGVAFPPMPKSLKQLKLDNNNFSSIPMSILLKGPNCLVNLEKLDISNNNLASIPQEISNLINLTEINADSNVIVSLPESIGELTKLKTLSLKDNRISVGTSSVPVFSEKNPQPLPKLLFTNTLLIDLNLHGNPMTSTQLNAMEGYDVFMERRQKVKTKDIYGGALTNLDVCGLP